MSLSPKLRFEVLKRDGFACQYCGRRAPAVALEVDHIVARAEGGTDDIGNLQTACFECNRGKRTGEVVGKSADPCPTMCTEHGPGCNGDREAKHIMCDGCYEFTEEMYRSEGEMAMYEQIIFSVFAVILRSSGPNAQNEIWQRTKEVFDSVVDDLSAGQAGKHSDERGPSETPPEDGDL